MRRQVARVGFGVAAVAGLLHAAWSGYWAAGGNALLDTLGQQLVTAFADRRWLLWPVTALKALVAVLPLIFDRRGWPPLTRALAWLAAAVLIVWGGMNTVVGNLVLTGVMDPAGGYDREAMIGHARLWDPLFLIWGVALAVGLASTRRYAARGRALPA